MLEKGIIKEKPDRPDLLLSGYGTILSRNATGALGVKVLLQ
jgi:hypothetical protein